MNLRTAAVLALVGMILLTLVAAVDFVNTFAGVMRDLIPSMTLIRAFIYLLASLSLTAFFFVFARSQQR